TARSTKSIPANAGIEVRTPGGMTIVCSTLHVESYTHHIWLGHYEPLFNYLYSATAAYFEQNCLTF
ncbi:MAG: hypothetical protein AB2689_28040, partial [Candidatus Thiodiazotropha taylori]